MSLSPTNMLLHIDPRDEEADEIFQTILTHLYGGDNHRISMIALQTNCLPNQRRAKSPIYHVYTLMITAV